MAHGVDAAKAEYGLIERGLNIAQEHGVEGQTVRQLHRDAGDCLAYGLGVEKNISGAVEHLTRAGEDLAAPVIRGDSVLEKAMKKGLAVSSRLTF